MDNISPYSGPTEVHQVLHSSVFGKVCLHAPVFLFLYLYAEAQTLPNRVRLGWRVALTQGRSVAPTPHPVSRATASVSSGNAGSLAQNKDCGLKKKTKQNPPTLSGRTTRFKAKNTLGFQARQYFLYSAPQIWCQLQSMALRNHAWHWPTCWKM